MSETDEPAFALQQQNTVAAQFGTWAEARDFFHWVAGPGLAEFRRAARGSGLASQPGMGPDPRGAENRSHHDDQR